MLIDSHAHLDEYPDFDDTVARARAAGISRIVLVGQFPRVRRALEIAGSDPAFFHATAGLHPHDAAQAREEDHAELRRICSDPGVVAVGECGLDFHYDRSPREAQREAFIRQIRLARELRKPLVVHTREADGETARLLEAELGVDGGVIHCFTGDWPAAQRYLALGLFLSFSGILTFRKADGVREAARNAPLERILIETDCPYLAPVPHRGKRNEPAYLAFTAARLAELRGMAVEELASATSANARRALRLPA